MTIVGARPQFIKAAPVSRALRRRHVEVLVHTGQHYDAQLSAVFFRELGLPMPDYALQVGSASHGAQTGRMLEAVEPLIERERPDAVLVYGDTNSTLAGALAASKLGVPVVHVEAGLRSFDRAMPEEVNRVLTDHLSDLLCCPSANAATHLAAEGITRGVHVVGDVMLDVLLETRAAVAASAPAMAAGAPVLLTLHRPANTDDPAQLTALMAAVGRVASRVVWPMHPRTRAALASAGLALPPNVQVTEPLGYRALVGMLANAQVVITDSGGLQKEAYWLGVPCLTVRRDTEWIETVTSGWNRLVDVHTDDLAACVRRAVRPDAPRDAYGAPGAAERIVQAMESRYDATASGATERATECAA
jgi:UDP-N-acetylglucosamine 2-epimerase